MSTLQQRIEAKISDGMAPTHLAVVNESGMHNVPPGSETHFRVLVVSAAFEGTSRLVRHRRLHSLLADELVEETWVESMRGARSLRASRISRAVDGACLVEGLTTWAFVDASTQRPRRIPADWIAAFTAPAGDAQGPRLTLVPEDPDR